jgi:hypothetical protein
MDSLLTDEQFQRICSDYQLYAKLLTIRDKYSQERGLDFNSPQKRYHQFKKDLRAKSVPVRIIILKYRQGGFTTYEQGESYMWAATRKNQEIMTIANTDDNTTKIFQMVQLMHDRMHPDFKPDRKGTSSRRLNFFRRNCNFYIGTAGADNIGGTLNKAHCSELAFWPDPKAQFAKLKEQVPLTGEIVIESTANGFNEFEEMYSGAQDLYNPGKSAKNSFYRFFIRWFDDPQYQLPCLGVKELDPLSTEEEQLVKTYGLTPSQIKWRRWKIGEFAGDEEKFFEMYPEDDLRCFLSTGRTYFNFKHILSIALAFAEDNPPITELSDFNIGLQVWEPPTPGLNYCAGADTAEGVEEDRSSLTIIEKYTRRTVLAFANDSVSAPDFAKILAKYCRDYNYAYLCVERNNHGHTVINDLVNHLGYGDPLLLYYHRDITEDMKPLRSRQKKEKNKTYKPGFPSQKNTKPLLLDTYKAFIEEMPYACIDKELLSEIKTFKRRPDGSLGADRPKHDDRIISHALALWAAIAQRPEDIFAQQYQIY